MISIIVCSINPEQFRHVCETYARVFAGEKCEVIGVHDAASLAEGYNRAVASAKGELIIFSHDDLEIISPDFKRRLMDHMAYADLVGVAGSIRAAGGAWALPGAPYIAGQIAHYSEENKKFYAGIWGAHARRVDGIKVMDGLFLCAHRKVVEAIPFDQETFTGFHIYDVDFTFRAYLAGFRLAVGCDLLILHGSTGNFDDTWARYEELFRLKHAGRLDVMCERTFRAATVGVDTFEELLRVMAPPWWDQ
jgi:GT2 family glycosyltransferase